jgi:hypothetical protein
MVVAFEEWWCSEDADGVVPRLYIRSLLEKVRGEYKLKKFTFAISIPELELRLIKYFSLLYKIVYNNLQKRIEGPNCLISKPNDWTERDEGEWQDAFNFYFDTVYWERVCGVEKSWEHRMTQWRYALPGILMNYTVRSYANLPHAEEDASLDQEYESYTEND